MGWLITPTSIPSTERCFELRVPDNTDIIAAVLGALEDLTLERTWVQTDALSASAAQTAEAMRDMVGNFVESECVVPVVDTYGGSYHTWFHGEDIILSGGALTWSSITASPFAGYWFQATPANGNAFKTPVFWLRAGSWKHTKRARQGNNTGLVTWTLRKASDNSQVGASQADDYYSASAIDFVSYQSDFTVTTDGFYYLRGDVSKFASSSAYNVLISLETLRWVSP